MSTVNEITDAAYLKCGIRSPGITEDAEALEALNNMVGSWSADIVIPVVTRENFDMVIGQAEYTIGSGGNFDTVRPISIANAYLKDSDGYSYSLKLIAAKDYNKIGTKTLEGKPESLYFIPEYPLGKIIFNKEAEEIYTIYFEFVKHLTEFANISATVSLPNEYKEALVYSLAIRLAENNSIELSRTIIEIAQITYSVISRLAVINRMPPVARFDFGSGAPSNIVTGE